MAGTDPAAGEGTFKKGGNRYDDEKPVHSVDIGYAFAIGRVPVTFEEYDGFCEATQRYSPSDSGWGRGMRPVINIDWQKAVEYCAWLSEQSVQTRSSDGLAHPNSKRHCRPGSFGERSAAVFLGDVQHDKPEQPAWQGLHQGGNVSPFGDVSE
ncbi:MAG: formylglycine-generating enzyme family protein [Burkholderiales bacterium]